jgi:sulfhydrogenase subunit beta (sulfur reductase)
MLDAIISTRELLRRVDELLRTRRVIGPVRRDVPDATPPVRWFYEPVSSARQIDLGFAYCVYSPKPYVLPPRETLLEFHRTPDGFSARPVSDARPTALVGVHPCDLHALVTLDRAFSHNGDDEHYQARRQGLLIVGVDCGKPCTPGVYCADMRAHVADEGFDVMLQPLDAGPGVERFGVRFGSPRGRTWLEAGGGCERPTAADERAADDWQQHKEASFGRTLTTAYEDLPAMMERSYDSLIWEATARRCYSCGSCNLVCPTCYCFDVHDELDLSMQGGRRCREWDGCQLRDFALVAGGHNFRSKAAARLRHRLMRKACWIGERTGGKGCVGCARCDRACTARISTVEIYNQLAEEV